MIDQRLQPRPGWIVQLSGHEFDLARWENSLKLPFDPWMETIPSKETTVRALRSSILDSVADAITARDVGMILVDRLNGVLFATAGTETVKFVTVGQVDKDGELHLHNFMSLNMTTRVMMSASMEVRATDGTLIVETARPSETQRWITLAAKCDLFADMLVFASRSDNWFDIYKAIELAQKLCGGESSLLRLLGDAAVKCKKLKTTANFHRHAQDYKPTVLTPLCDAKPLLAHLVRTAASQILRSED